MQKLWAITWKELYTTFRDRNLVLIMFVTPIVLSTIMGFAFGGLADDAGISVFQDIPIAVVDLDSGFNLADELTAGPEGLDAVPSLAELEFLVGDEPINLGEELQLNANFNLTTSDLVATNVSFAYGDLLASILLSEPITTTESTTTTSPTLGANAFDLGELTCPLFEDKDETEAPFGFSGTLDDLLAAERIADAAVARAGVERGDFVAAVIIPPTFTAQMLPTFEPVTAATASGTLTGSDTGSAALTATIPVSGAVEIYANGGQAISASIVRAVVTGIVNQLIRMSVAVDAVVDVTGNQLQEVLSAERLEDLDLSAVDPQVFTSTLQSIDGSLLEPLACLLLPDAGNVRLVRQPLDTLQTRSAFATIMIVLGAAQAIFFALFTGIFGINSIYQEREQWTLQRIIASPTPRVWILGGKLLGNVMVVAAQLAILFLSFTVITSLVEGEPVFIWGTNIPALLAVILAVALFTSGLGVLVVGIARNAQQVQFFGPMIASVLGALGGSFGFRLPAEIASFSPIWWGTEALQRISNGEAATVTTPLLVLFGSAVIAFVAGVMLFRRRLAL